YSGHLLMPYAWYALYANSAHTAIDKNDDENRSQWLVEYFDNPDLMGAPLETRAVAVPLFPGNSTIPVALPQEIADVDFNWGTGSPVQYRLPLPLGMLEVLPTDNFSVRFSKIMRFREGWLRFTLSGDDGVRLYVDDCLVINQWKQQPSTTYT